MWKRRLVFNVLFVLGTLCAVIGWMQDGQKRHIRWLALAGHAVQVVGIFGSLLTPDRQEQHERDEFSNRSDEDVL